MSPKKSQETEDRLLVERLRRGDRGAFTVFYNRLFPGVCHTCRGWLGAYGSLAEDAAQLAFLRVFRRIVTFRGDSALTTWVFSIAQRESRRLFAREQRHAAAQATSEGSCSAGGDANHEGLGDLDRLIEEAGLTARQEYVWQELVVTGRSGTELARELRVSESYVSQTKATACKKLQSAYAALTQDDAT